MKRNFPATEYWMQSKRRVSDYSFPSRTVSESSSVSSQAWRPSSYSFGHQGDEHFCRNATVPDFVPIPSVSTQVFRREMKQSFKDIFPDYKDVVDAAETLISMPSIIFKETPNASSCKYDSMSVENLRRYDSPSIFLQATSSAINKKEFMAIKLGMKSTYTHERNGSVVSSDGTIDSLSDDSSTNKNHVYGNVESLKKNIRRTMPSSPSSVSSCEEWFSGSTLLCLPEDDDNLSPLHCFMRKYCLEAFTATNSDVSQPRYGRSYGSKVSVGQVGIRCLHCKARPSYERGERAVCYPSSTQNIYHSMETWQRRHAVVCKDISPWVKKKMLELMESSRHSAGGRRQYWGDSALRLGMVDTEHGIRFRCDPARNACCEEQDSNNEPNISKINIPNIVTLADKDLVTDHLYLLMEQLELCRFCEEDRVGGRSKIKNYEVGYPGLQCKHCSGKAGVGRYFPASLKGLTLANSDRNFHNHMIKCRRCPHDIKVKLRHYHQRHGEGHKNKRRKVFFSRVWDILQSSRRNLDGKCNERPSSSTTVFS